jgi:hypothetical protein
MGFVACSFMLLFLAHIPLPMIIINYISYVDFLSLGVIDATQDRYARTNSQNKTNIR